MIFFRVIPPIKGSASLLNVYLNKYIGTVGEHGGEHLIIRYVNSQGRKPERNTRRYMKTSNWSIRLDVIAKI